MKYAKLEQVLSNNQIIYGIKLRQKNGQIFLKTINSDGEINLLEAMEKRDIDQ